MQHFTHQSHIDKLPASPLRLHITARFNQLSEDTDVPPNIVLVEADDDITGPDYAFVGEKGLLSDLFEESSPGESSFARPWEWVCQLARLDLFEALLLFHSEDGVLVIIPEAIVEAHPDLKWVLTDESQGGLSDPQPL